MPIIFMWLIVLVFSGCDLAKNQDNNPDFKWSKVNPPELGAEPYAMDSPPILIKGARIMTAAGPTLENANLFMEGGLIRGLSERDIIVPEGTKVIEAKGKTITPGLIDVHSHIGLFNSPQLAATMDFNEQNRSFSQDVWAEHGFYPQDPMLWRALGSGVTTFQVLHGSSNLIGGRSFIAKLIPKVSARSMRFFGAKQGVKLACGENVKGGDSPGRFSISRMGNMAGWRKTFQEAIEYQREWDSFEPNDPKAKIPKRNLELETLVKVMKGEILVHWHCYRGDDISNILDVAQEFGFKIRTIHHGLEAYKVRKRLAQEEVATATWTDWWGFKQEAYDGIPQNAALLYDAGARAIIHSDSESDIRFLNIEAAKAMMAGRRVGIMVTPEEALQWVTSNPAWALGLEDKIGSLEKGKMADVVVWDGHPFSIYSKAQFVFVNGNLVFDREQQQRPVSDREVGIRSREMFDGRNFSAPPLTNQLIFPDLLTGKKPQDEEYILTNVTVFDGEKILSESQNLKISKQEASLISTLDVEKSGLKVIDGQGQYLTPGLVESSTFLGLVDIFKTQESKDNVAFYDRPAPDNYARDGLDLTGVRIPIAREQGVTTVVAHPTGKLISGFAASFDLDPQNPGIKDKVFLESSLLKPWSWGSNEVPASRTIVWRDLRAIVSDSLAAEPYGNGQHSSYFLTKNDLQAMKPVVFGRTPWVMEASRASHIGAIIRFKNNFAKNIKPIVRGAHEAWMIADKLASEKIPVVLQPDQQYPHTLAAVHARYDSAAYLADKGVELVITSGANSTTGPGRLRQQAGIAVKYGLKYPAALRAITSTPAKIFDLGQKGTLASKDWVLWTGDPLEPTSVAEKVWIGGKEMDLDTRQKKLARKYLSDSQ